MKKVFLSVCIFVSVVNMQVRGFDFKDTYNYSINTFIDRVLSHLKKTRYKNRPFDLKPAPNGQIDKNTTFSLCVDCSGFVGYYVLQSLYPNLYAQIPRDYSCGPLVREKDILTPPARPLAADFADYFKSLRLKADKDNSKADSSKKKCFGQVNNLQDILPGDIIAYKYKNHIYKHVKFCCKKIKCNNMFCYKTYKINFTDTTCKEGRIIYKTKRKGRHHMSSGHVMFARSIPVAVKIKKSRQKWYALKVADSTTVLHTDDTRKNSLFKNGVGEGTVYIREDLKAIIPNHSKIKKVNIYIGRVVNCTN
jgi:hypothetical protein